MSRRRRAIAIFVFFTVVVAFICSLMMFDVNTKSVVIRHYSEAPWIRTILCAYGFGTMLVPLGLGELNEPIKRTMKYWALFLVFSLLVWIGPIMFAPRLSWTGDDCFTASLMISIIPTFLEPFGFLSDWLMKGRKEQNKESASQ